MNSSGTYARLADLCKTFTDGDWIESKDQSDHGIRLIQTGNVGVGRFKDRGEKARFVSEETFSRLNCTEIFAGDCLISRLPDPVGRACLIPPIAQRMITAVDCAIVRFDRSQILPEFFVYFSQSAGYYDQVAQLTTGTTRARISRSNLGSIFVPIPPLAEQARIVAILDEAFKEIAEAMELAKRSAANVLSFFNAELSQMPQRFSETTSSRKIREVTSKVGSGATPRGGRESYNDTGTLLVRSLNVYDRSFRTKGLAFLDKEQADKLAHATIFSGDVLLNITGASIARCCVAPKEVVGGRVNQHVSIIRPVAEELSPYFLAYALTSNIFKRRLLGIGDGAGSTRQALTKADILEFKVPIPPLSEQLAVCSKLDALELEKQALLQIYERKLALLDKLKQSLLGRAFSGELSTKSTANNNIFVTAEQVANILAVIHWRHEKARRDKTYGHVKAQKALHFVEHIGGVELGRKPIKDAAGPNDFEHMKRAEKWAQDNLFFEFVERAGGGYEFKKLPNHGALLSAAKQALKPVEGAMDRVSDLIVPMDSEAAEVLATVHAAWNNLLAEGREATPDAIVREARDDWHRSKMLIAESKFRDAIKLIKAKGIIPDGTAKPVLHRQLNLL